MKFDFSAEGSKSRYLKASLKLFAQRGYDSVSVRDISREAGTSEAALYKHFKGKEEMALYLFRLILKTYTAEIKKIAEERERNSVVRLQDMQRYTYQFYAAAPESIHFALLSQYKFWPTVEDDLKPHFWMRSVLAEGIERGEITQNITLLTLVSLYTGLVLEPLIQSYFFKEAHISWTTFTEEVAASIYKLLVP